MVPVEPSNLLQASINSFRGIVCLLRERSAQRELLLLIGFLIAHGYYPSIYLEIVILLVGIMLALEAINTAIEKLSDIIEPNFSPAIKEIKDLGSSSIMIILFLISVIILKMLWY